MNIHDFCSRHGGNMRGHGREQPGGVRKLLDSSAMKMRRMI
jgi:hypothetical protein